MYTRELGWYINWCKYNYYNCIIFNLTSYHSVKCGVIRFDDTKSIQFNNPLKHFDYNVLLLFINTDQ